MQNSQRSKEVTGTAPSVGVPPGQPPGLPHRVWPLHPQARQFVNHGHILVNGRKVSIPFHNVRVNGLISVREESRRNDKIMRNIADCAGVGALYTERDLDNYRGKLTRLPGREEIPVDVNEILIIELYLK